MTNKLDNRKQRIEIIGEGKENTNGVPLDGYQDASGEYPKRDYFFGSSIGKSARGETIETLWVGGGDAGVDVSVADQQPSRYPYNSANLTQSGHALEIDDTPGGERILIKHRTGAGMELRADGSVIISSRGKRVSITGEDDVVIVEGTADLVYKGDVNLHVAGNFNVDVEGNYHVNVAGDHVQTIKGRKSTQVDLDANMTVNGSRSDTIGNFSTETVLGRKTVNVKQDYFTYVESSIEFDANGSIVTTAGDEWTVSASSAANITARHVSILGHKGSIGGIGVNHIGNQFFGIPSWGASSAATFQGTLLGTATAALVAGDAAVAGTALWAVTAGCAPKGVSVPSAAIPIKTKVTTMLAAGKYAPIPTILGMLSPAVTETQLMTTRYGVRSVNIPATPEDLTLRDEYDKAFITRPNIHMVRSKLRDAQWRNNGTLTSRLVAEDRLNSTFTNTIPKNIGRSASKDGTVRFGMEVIGNNPSNNRSKRFIVK